VLAATDKEVNKGTPPKLILAVTEEPLSLTIAILVTHTAMFVGDVYRVVLEVAAAPLNKVIDVLSAI
jgi:hypothetical protein